MTIKVTKQIIKLPLNGEKVSTVLCSTDHRQEAKHTRRKSPNVQYLQSPHIFFHRPYTRKLLAPGSLVSNLSGSWYDCLVTYNTTAHGYKKFLKGELGSIQTAKKHSTKRIDVIVRNDCD